jgi:hypothetical protein
LFRIELHVLANFINKFSYCNVRRNQILLLVYIRSITLGSFLYNNWYSVWVFLSYLFSNLLPLLWKRKLGPTKEEW